MISQRLTLYIVIGMALGIAVGHFCNTVWTDKETLDAIALYFSTGSLVFLRLIKMIVAPLVFSTLVGGIAHMKDTSAVGRIGAKAMLWFVSASLASLLVGMIMVNVLQPGVGANLILPASDAKAVVDGNSLGGVLDFVKHLVPQSIIEAMANNEILQIVVFALFFGVACSLVGEKSRRTLEIVEEVSHIILKVTSTVMLLAPIAVFCAMANTITVNGIGVLGSLARFMGEFYFTLGMLWVLLIGIGFSVIGRSIFRLLNLVREPALIAFSTSSSEAAYPKLMEQLSKFPIAERIVSFVLPLGYSFNLDGGMIYLTFAVVFIAQAYNVHLMLGQEIIMLLTLMITSKGMAGVPRASMVVIAATLPQFHLPANGVMLILGIDQFLDMGRSATNVIGNSIATAVVAKWEGALTTDSTLVENDMLDQDVQVPAE